MRVESSDQEVPLVAPEPAEIITMSDEQDGASVDPLVEELLIPRCVLP